MVIKVFVQALAKQFACFTDVGNKILLLDDALNFKSSCASDWMALIRVTVGEGPKVVLVLCRTPSTLSSRTLSHILELWLLFCSSAARQLERTRRPGLWQQFGYRAPRLLAAIRAMTRTVPCLT
jgi:hypothetical protein